MANRCSAVTDLGDLTEKQIAIYTAESARRQKSVLVSYLLLVFLGGLGLHQFYMGGAGSQLPSHRPITRSGGTRWVRGG